MYRTAQKHPSYQISIRIALPAVFTILLFVLATFFIILPALEESFMAQKREMIHELTESAWSILVSYEERVKNGELSRKDAQSRAIKHIFNFRYGKERKDYFWINDMEPRMIMHPYRSDLDGKNISDFQDPKGKHLFVEFVRVVREHGSGYVDYMWQWKDDANLIVPKLSYVKGFEPWGWIIGSGIYIDDVHAEVAKIRNKLSAVATAILLIVAFLAFYMVRQTVLGDRLRKRMWKERGALLEALEISEDQYRSMMEYTSDWIWEIDKDGIYTYSSPKVQDLLGYLPEEIVGKTPFDIMIAGEGEHAGKKLQKAILSGQPFVGLEIICRHKNGSSIVIEKNSVPFYGVNREIIGFRGVARDISDRKRTEEDLWKSHNQLYKNLEETVRSLALTAEKRDPYTAGHQMRVERLVHAIALELGLAENQLQGLYFAALLHDIGKVSVPSEYLAKPTTLTKEERSIIQCHSEAGYEILKNIHFPWPVAEIVYQHHELLDGSGYPRGLTGPDILLEAKIITVADVVEAMSSHRPYRPSLGIEAALDEIRSNKDIKYDIESVEACIYLIEEKKFNLEAEGTL
jgi:PAS domain S-box-containing protein/putative nucleotidyltransferase with HDIG domain